MSSSGVTSNQDNSSSSISYWTLLKNSPRHHQFFFATVLVQCLCVVLERCLLILNTKAENVRQDVWFFLVIMISVGFVGYFAVHSVLQTNAFETAAFFFASLLLITRLAVEYANNSDECANQSRVLCGVFLGVNLVFIIAAMAFTQIMYKDLEWKRYKAIGAEVSTRRMYKLFELFSALRKLDLQFSLIALITGLTFFVQGSTVTSTIALSVNCVLFIIELAWERLGDSGIKGEEPKALFGFWALSGALPICIILSTIDVISNGTNGLFGDASWSVRATIVVMGILAIVNRVATVVCSVLLFRNFGPNYVGLRRIIMGDRKGKFNQRAQQASFAPDSGVSMSVNNDPITAEAKAASTTSTSTNNNPTSTGVINPVDVALAVGVVKEWAPKH
jgi:hypothetical protein